MFERSPYPLLALKLLGSLCPCVEKEEDTAARSAAWALSSTPIRWHRKLRGASDGRSASAVGGFISGMFGSAAASGLAGGDTYKPLEGAYLSVVDAPSGPQLVASPAGIASTIRKKVIPLKLIKKVQARGGIMASRSGIEILDNTGREILRFDVLKAGASPMGDEEFDNENGESRNGAEDAEESTREDIIDQLDILIEWERRRQAYIVTLGEDEPDEETYVDEYDDDDGTPDSPSRGGRVKGAIAEKGEYLLATHYW